jgi:hypothetical protein
LLSTRTDYPTDAASLEEMGYKFISDVAPAQVERYNTFNLRLVDNNGTRIFTF